MDGWIQKREVNRQIVYSVLYIEKDHLCKMHAARDKQFICHLSSAISYSLTSWARMWLIFVLSFLHAPVKTVSSVSSVCQMKQLSGWLTHSPLSMAGEIKRQGQTWAWQNVDQLIHMQISASQERPHAMHILAPFIDLSRVRAPTQKGRKQPTTSAMAAKMAQPMKKFVTFCYVIFVGL